MRALCLTLLLAALLAPGCSDESPKYYTEASREERDGVHVLKLVGTPFEMGLQHGELMAPELAEGVAFVEQDSLFSLFLPLARSQGLIEDALAQSYPDVLDECEGMAEAARRAGVPGWTLETCIALAYGDVILAFVQDLVSPGCTQFMAAGPASIGGRLVHGRNMDWDRLSYLIDHPTVIVRQPTGEIPFLTVGFPGCVAPYNGLNAAGIAIASNDNSADPAQDPNQRGRRGHTQMIHQALAGCDSLEAVEAFLRGEPHSRATILGVSDGAQRTAAVFELSPSHLAVRRMDADGLVYATNHFLDPAMDPLDTNPKDPTASTACRLRRLEELLPPDGRESLHGQLDPARATEVLGDRYGPCTGETAPEDAFDTNSSIGTNGAIWSMVFLPEERTVYFAGGEPPVPLRPYVGFDLDDLLTGEDGTPDPPAPPALE
ncbi:MAG TPA: C45 family autoproteolytic acyltransferase/hydrolase [Myxococcota bacterium]|nr:C45 family autoproteolytic acyltransferase/hydrolase [Myxococcota bacterium]HRY92809.1 C45 family autoproteolytic acyltransferase/hydrolase [Myxococcota bacterium]HSA19815.1 C45 family autoproteolytic acyltransferase/hydrolase [Myxococcota bacterium]